MIITQKILLEKMVCGTCGITHAAPRDWVERRRAEAGDIHCPNGCRRVWKESDADRLRKQLENRERELREAKCETLRKQQLLDAEQLLREKAEKKLRRVSNGVCPCCKRFVKQLANHMKTKHPDLCEKQNNQATVKKLP